MMCVRHCIYRVVVAKYLDSFVVIDFSLADYLNSLSSSFCTERKKMLVQKDTPHTHHRHTQHFSLSRGVFLFSQIVNTRCSSTVIPSLSALRVEQLTRRRSHVVAQPMAFSHPLSSAR